MTEPLRDQLLGMAVLAVLLVFASLVYTFSPSDLEDWAKVAEITAVSAGILGGAWALFRFAHERRVRRAEVLLRLYDDFQEQLKIFAMIEDDRQYKDIYSPLIEGALAVPAGAGWSQGLKPLDQALRHLLLVYNLYKNRQLDRETVAVTYRYYALMLMRDQRQLVRLYVHRYFPTLAGFLEDKDIFPEAEHLFPVRVVSDSQVRKLVGGMEWHRANRQQVLAEFEALNNKLSAATRAHRGLNSKP